LDGDDTVDIDWALFDAVDGTVELIFTGNLKRSLDNFSLTVGNRGVVGELSNFLLSLIESFKSQCNSICLPINLTEWDIIFGSIFETITSINLGLASRYGHFLIFSKWLQSVFVQRKQTERCLWIWVSIFHENFIGVTLSLSFEEILLGDDFVVTWIG
jgi:hypothetical protein